MVLHKARLDLHLLLRLQILHDVSHDLICHSVNMRSALGGPDAVDKRHAEGLVRRAVGNRNVPALIRCLVDNGVAPKRLRILCQVLALHSGVVPTHLHLLAQSHRQIPDTTLNQLEHLCRNLCHTEPRKVRLPIHCHT